VLFSADLHEPLIEAAWAPAAVEAEIRAIVRDAEEALSPDWWPGHPRDYEEGDPDVWHGVYLGAAGVLWALDHLGSGLDHVRLAGALLESYLRRPEFDRPPSAWIGESGIARVAWRLAPSDALADRLAELVAVPGDDTLELMWGSPGLLLIADAMLEATGEPRWASAWHGLADHVMGRRDERGLWTQELSGRSARFLGPAHGMAGVVAALARRQSIDPVDALESTAVREGAHANWPPLAGVPLERDGAIRTQWCHGAPGMVTSMAALPADERLDALLLAGGELTWAAGPLRKGANLCHGTAGNGFAFLKLFTRTGDEFWLDRARRFAMHAAAQVAAARREYGRGHYTLWTGDLGTAVFLQQCIAGTSDLPALDIW
jgi:hypothetical protein